MFAITGVTGQVGGAAASALLEAGHNVRAVLRDTTKAAQWEQRGAEVAIASFEDADALTAAFRDTAGVFVMIAPNFAPEPGYPNAHAAAAVLKEALSKARPLRVAALSSVGGQRESAPRSYHTSAYSRRSTRGSAAAHRDFAARVVHGELAVGHRARSRNRRDAELSATA